LAEAAAPRTAGEVEEVQTALRAARSALRVACRAAAPGAPVAALVAGFAASMSGFGAGFPLGEGLVWRTGPGFVRLPATTALAAGDVIALELGLYLHCHAGLAGVTVAVGGGDLAAARRAWFVALCDLAKRCRPGATAADLRAAAIAAGARYATGAVPLHGESSVGAARPFAAVVTAEHLHVLGVEPEFVPAGVERHAWPRSAERAASLLAELVGRGEHLGVERLPAAAGLALERVRAGA